MNVTCDQCQRRYVVPDDKFTPGKPLKLRCKECQAVITVAPPPKAKGAANPWEDEPTRAAPTLDKNAQWFALVDDEQKGPFSVLQLEEQIRSKQLALTTMLWREGLGDWQAAQDVPELVPLFAGVRASRSEPKAEPPPPPPPPRAEPRPTPAPALAAKPSSHLANLFDDGEATQLKPPKKKPAPKVANEPKVIVEQELAGQDAEDEAPPRRTRPLAWVLLLLVLAVVGGALYRFFEASTAEVPAPEKAQPDKAQAGSAPKKIEYGVKPAALRPVDPNAPTQPPDLAQMKQVLASAEPAFKSCIAQQKAPKLAGTLELTATVGSTGKVLGARFDKAELYGTPLGECLTVAAKAVSFAPFAGEPVDVQIPLNL